MSTWNAPVFKIYLQRKSLFWTSSKKEADYRCKAAIATSIKKKQPSDLMEMKCKLCNFWKPDLTVGLLKYIYLPFLSKCNSLTFACLKNLHGCPTLQPLDGIQYSPSPSSPQSKIKNFSLCEDQQGQGQMYFGGMGRNSSR